MYIVCSHLHGRGGGWRVNRSEFAAGTIRPSLVPVRVGRYTSLEYVVDGVYMYICI